MSSRNYNEEVRNIIKYALLAIVALNVLVVIVLHSYFNKDIIERLNVLVDNSLLLSQNKELLPLLKGADEIANLDKVFHNAADALAKAQRAERAIVDNALDVICSLDSNLKFDTINPACLDVWGFEAEELQGKRMITLVVPDDVEKTLKQLRKSKPIIPASRLKLVLRRNPVQAKSCSGRRSGLIRNRFYTVQHTTLLLLAK